MKKLIVPIVITIIALFLLTGCAQSADSPMYSPDHSYGFWAGLWHGICVPMSFLGEILPESTVSIYAINNTGKPYDAGFFLGLCFLFGAGCYVNYEIRRDKE